MRTYSEVGSGTNFKILLPATTDGEVTTGTMKPPVVDGLPSDALVLVVDDEAYARRTARRVLESAGFEVLVASEGVEVVSVFTERRDDIRAVLLDLTMPRMDGAETFCRLRQLNFDITVILMSSYNE